ncbi:MAG: hypothetical protein RIQ33_1455 [Bacteroidota bacterium]|jgi:hypothetical protein
MFRVVKSNPPRKNFNYNDADIVELVQKDFHLKCYLCEEQIPRHLEVEHFFPQVHFPHLINDWANLICICGKCNKIRPKNINKIGNEVLNPCVDEVDKNIELSIDFIADKILITAHNTENKTTNTVTLLDRIHNGTNSTSPSYKHLQIEIKKNLSEFEQLIANYYGTINQEGNKNLMKEKLSVKSPFTAFKRWYILNNEKYRLDFEELFD